MDFSQLSNVLETALVDGLYERDDLYVFNTQLAWEISNEAHVYEEQEKILVEALKSHDKVAELFGFYLNCGYGGCQFTPDGIAKWLLTRAMKHSVNTAIDELRLFIESQHCEVLEFLAFSGLEVKRSIRLTDTIELLPMSAIPESILTISMVDPDWSSFGRDKRGYVRRTTSETLFDYGKQFLHSNPHNANTALVVRHRIKPKLVTDLSKFRGCQKNLQQALLLVAASTCTAMFPVAHSLSPTLETPMSGSSIGWKSWSHVNALRKLAYAEDHIDSIKNTLQNWEVLDENRRKKLKVSLERLNRALGATSPTDCAIELGVSLEALLLGDLQPNDQISLAFRLRGSWLLGENVAERKKLAKQFNAIYSCRSTAIHSGNLPSDSYEVGEKKVSAEEFILNHAPNLACRAILEVISCKEMPSWNSLILGE